VLPRAIQICRLESHGRQSVAARSIGLFLAMPVRLNAPVPSADDGHSNSATTPTSSVDTSPGQSATHRNWYRTTSVRAAALADET